MIDLIGPINIVNYYFIYHMVAFITFAAFPLRNTKQRGEKEDIHAGMTRSILKELRWLLSSCLLFALTAVEKRRDDWYSKRTHLLLSPYLISSNRLSTHLADFTGLWKTHLGAMDTCIDDLGPVKLPWTPTSGSASNWNTGEAFCHLQVSTSEANLRQHYYILMVSQYHK